MRVSLDGQYSIDEFADAVDRMLQHFRQNGIDEIINANVYVNLRSARRGVRMFDDDGVEVGHLRMDGPRRRAFRKASSGIHVLPVPAKPGERVVDVADSPSKPDAAETSPSATG